MRADISEYGLDSINVMLLVAKLREDFGVQLDPRGIVGCRTITDLVEYLAVEGDLLPADAAPASERDHDGVRPSARS